MLLLVDENVPRSVARFLAERGHDVRLVQELFPRGTPDPVIAAMGDHLSAIIVTWDKDFAAFIRRIPAGNRAQFRRAGRISFQCNEANGRRLIERWIEIIELHYKLASSHSDTRMIVQIFEQGIKFW